MSTGKRIIHDLADEELIHLVQGATSKDIFDKITEAGKFIYSLKINHGSTKVSSQLVYHTYKVFKGWDNKKQSKGVFFRDFNKYFEPKRTADGKFYLLNSEPFDLSQETYWIIRSEIRNEKNKKEKKSN